MTSKLWGTFPSTRLKFASSPGARSTEPAGVPPPSLVAGMGSDGGGGGGGLEQAASRMARTGRMRRTLAFTVTYLALETKTSTGRRRWQNAGGRNPVADPSSLPYVPLDIRREEVSTSSVPVRLTEP